MNYIQPGPSAINMNKKCKQVVIETDSADWFCFLCDEFEKDLDRRSVGLNRDHLRITKSRLVFFYFCHSVYVVQQLKTQKEKLLNSTLLL